MRTWIAKTGLTQGGAARLMGVGDRTSRRWALDETPIPGTVARLLWLCERFPEVLPALRDEWRDEGEEAAQGEVGG